MRKKLRIAALIGAGLMLAAGLGLVALYRASQQVPEFYRRALPLDPIVADQASEEMLQQSLALGSDVRKEGRWQALFTSEQLNGWLAMGLKEKHPEVLPDGVGDPRLAVRPDSVMLGCRVRRGRINSVVSLTVVPYLAEPNVLALRIRKVSAGAVPLPLGKVLDHVSEAAARAGVPLRWRQADGDPVALIPLDSLQNESDKSVQLEVLRLDEGEIYLAGTTTPRPKDRPPTRR